MIIIYTTFPNSAEAVKIGKGMLRNKLIACINFFKIESIYRWNDKIVNDHEIVSLIKTKKSNFRKVAKYIQDNHSYSTPCIIEIPLNRVNNKYLQWLKKETM